MKYKFSENILGPNFREDVLDQIRILINTGSSFNIIGMPFVGISPFFRYLATTELAYFAYMDVHALFHRKKEDLFLSLYRELGGLDVVSKNDAFEACKELIKKLLQSEKKIMIMINRIDYLDRDEYKGGIFSNLKSLEDIGKGRIIFAVASSKPLYEIDELAVSDSNLAFFSKIVYFPPYSGKDLDKLLLVSPVALKPNASDIKNALYLSGGHATLLQVLIKTEFLDKPFLDPFIKLHLKVIYESCNSRQRNILYKLAIGKKIENIDGFLLKIGIVSEVAQQYKLFSPLFREYLVSYVKLKLSKNERKLFTILKKNLGKTISKEKLFQTLWGNNPDHGTDWALNSLIYRLRKNPTLINNKYIIENEKDIGYRMIKET